MRNMLYVTLYLIMCYLCMRFTVEFIQVVFSVCLVCLLLGNTITTEIVRSEED